MTRSRIVASLLHTNTVNEFFARAQIDSSRVLHSVEDPNAVPFEECQRRVWRDLADSGVEFLSAEHQASVQHRPLESPVKGVFAAMLERHGQIGAAPLEFLLDLIRADPDLAERLAPHGLDAESISAALEER